MVEHKIQSSKGGLTLELDDVPKMLQNLTSRWCPSAFVVSFKLETDPSLVVSKARRAIVNYGVHLVVANQLQTRRDVVYLVAPESTEESYITINRPATEKSIEPLLVDMVIEQHDAFLIRKKSALKKEEEGAGGGGAGGGGAGGGVGCSTPESISNNA